MKLVLLCDAYCGTDYSYTDAFIVYFNNVLPAFGQAEIISGMARLLSVSEQEAELLLKEHYSVEDPDPFFGSDEAKEVRRHLPTHITSLRPKSWQFITT